LFLLPFFPRVHKKDNLAVNPLGTVPAFVDGGTAMTELMAICKYLAANCGGGALRVKSAVAPYGTYLN